MADPAHELVLQGLQRAASEPQGLPMLISKSAPGLFAANAAGKKAAQSCLAQGLLQVARTERRGKSTVVHAGITEAGLTYLLEQVHPRKILATFIEAVEARRCQLDQLLELVRVQQKSLSELGQRVDQVLAAWNTESVRAAQDQDSGKDKVTSAILDHLDRWQQRGTLGDCPLPHLFKVCAEPAPSIGQFHDAVRRLHDGGHIYLHPWTGPLYEIPEPALALLTGHEVAYYASPRC